MKTASAGFEPSDITSVFCFSTVTGSVSPGSRDTHKDGHIAYNPWLATPTDGVRWIVGARSAGHYGQPRLDQQTGLSRMCIRVAGMITSGFVVPASDQTEVSVLIKQAQDALAVHRTSEWSCALVQFNERQIPAIQVSDELVARELAQRAGVPFVLSLAENLLRVTDLTGSMISTVRADTVFDVCAVPSWAPVLAPPDPIPLSPVHIVSAVKVRDSNGQQEKS